MNDLTLICQVVYGEALLHSGIYPLSKKIPEFSDFYLPSQITTGPIDCRLTIMDRDNSIVAYKVWMAPAASSMITRMINVNILILIKSILQK